MLCWKIFEVVKPPLDIGKIFKYALSYDFLERGYKTDTNTYAGAEEKKLKKIREAINKWIERRERFKRGNVLRDPNALFISIHNSGANKTRGYRFKPSGVCEMLRGYSNKAGLEKNMNVHSMRHYMGRNIIEKRGSNSDVTNILGHSCIESSMDLYHDVWKAG